MARFHLHLVSDSTGETLDSILKAGLSQFEQVDIVKHFWPLVRSEGHLERVLAEIAEKPGLVLYTLVSDEMRNRLERQCARMGLPVIAVMDRVIEGLERLFGLEARARPGMQHRLDEEYFGRIDAIDWTMEHDDGALSHEWEEADIVLLGVSRTSKTPTSLYLANRGYRVANYPIVPDRPIPDILYRLEKPLIVGLTVMPERLAAVRRARMVSDGAEAYGQYYTELARVTEEVAAARRLFAAQRWPVIDVTRRSIEETAAAVLNLMPAREE